MKNVPIKNQEILEALNNFLWFYNNRGIIERNYVLHGTERQRKEYVSSEYRDKVIAMNENHDGFPETIHSYALKADRIVHVNNNSVEVAEAISKYSDYNQQLAHMLCTKNNALTQMYPPGGFIAWHNNANASAYNIIFSWSETGEGCFRYVDGHTGDEVVMQDVKGWQCKAGYFGAYGEPWYNRVYHAAETDCWRLTVSYMFDRSQMSMGLQDEIVEEIMSEI
jgi:hypothetical protein